MKAGASHTQSVGSAIDDVLQAAQFFDSRAVRRIAADTKRKFKSWEPLTEQGTSFVEIKGTKVELANAVDLVELSRNLMFLADLQRERLPSGW